MERILIDFAAEKGAVKPLHAVNNCPIRPMSSQCWGNFDIWPEMGAPYGRTHDTAHEYHYGLNHVIDISGIFPDFDADESDPASYDFLLTDKLIADTYACGTEIFYRLGESIDHRVKKYHVLPPKDYAKWARIAEHIIRHYTEGWADGFRYKMTYWEIWNEPENTPVCWTGTEEQFRDFFEVAAKHLKACFPHLKIGGPALGGVKDYAARFLAEMHRRDVPMDFFSWHRYGRTPEEMLARVEYFREQMDINGYGEAESICNEWNYVKNWTDQFVHSLEAIHGIKGAAYAAGCILICDSAPVDMLMYYDARPCTFNGIFDYYSMRPLPTFHTLRFFDALYKLGISVTVSRPEAGLYAAAAKDGKGNSAVMLCHYDYEETGGPREVALSLSGGAAEYEVCLLDETHGGETVGTWRPGDALTLAPQSIILLKSL